jgi:hypothetical protein
MVVLLIIIIIIIIIIILTQPPHRLWNKKISKYEGGLITLGLEAGRDILPSRVKFKEESLAVVHLADSAGLSKHHIQILRI